MKELFLNKNNFKYMTALMIVSVSTILILNLTVFERATAAGSVNINTDKFERLLDIPGVDEIIAAKILKYRKDNGGFKTVYDLMKIPEITGESFEKMKDVITAGNKPASSQPATPSSPQPAPVPGPPANVTAPVRASDDDGAPEKTAPASRIAENPAGESPAASDETQSETVSDEGRTDSPKAAIPAKAVRPIRGRIDDIKRIDMTAENYYKIIMSLMRMGKYDQAEKSLGEYIEKFPGDSRIDDARYLLGACLEEREKFSEAVKVYTAVYDNTKSGLRGISLFRTAVCMDVLGNSKDALETYRKYISEFPDSSCVKDAEGRVSNMVKVK